MSRVPPLQRRADRAPTPLVRFAGTLHLPESIFTELEKLPADAFSSIQVPARPHARTPARAHARTHRGNTTRQRTASRRALACPVARTGLQHGSRRTDTRRWLGAGTAPALALALTLALMLALARCWHWPGAGTGTALAVARRWHRHRHGTARRCSHALVLAGFRGGDTADGPRAREARGHHRAPS
jgi:hypothetical protein